MSFLLRRIYHGVIYQPNIIQFHPMTNLFLVFVIFLILLFGNIQILFILSIIIITENFLLGNGFGSLSLLKAVSPFLIFLGIITYLFSGFELAIIIVLRFFCGSLSFSLFFAITNPADLSRALEKIYIPPRWALIPSLSLTLVPRIAKDAEETFEALYLRGEIKGFFLRWLPKTLAIILASVIYRSEFLARSLYYKGFNLGPRSHYRKFKFHRNDFYRGFFWLGFFIFTALVI
ncbi:energy-coupling factor transporter transmembrane component T family protein [Candidatus Hodarchaeum mangrovi]